MQSSDHGDGARVREHRIIVGRRVRAARLALLTTSAEWTRRYGAEANTVANWMNGRSYPDNLFLADLCNDTGLTFDWFMRGTYAGVASGLLPSLKVAEASVADMPPSKRGRPRDSTSE